MVKQNQHSRAMQGLMRYSLMKILSGLSGPRLMIIIFQPYFSLLGGNKFEK